MNELLNIRPLTRYLLSFDSLDIHTMHRSSLFHSDSRITVKQTVTVKSCYRPCSIFAGPQ